jgi:hypothetical protein
LNGLTTVQPIAIDENDGSSQWNISEICPLNIKTLNENFSINADLWNKNGKKLTELFSIVENDY